MDPDQLQEPHSSSADQRRRASRLRLLLPIAVIAISAVVAVWMMKSSPKAKARPQVRNAVLVDVRPVEFGPQTTSVTVMGTVKPQREVDLKPQVSGEIITISDKLIPGGHFSRDEQLLTIDPSDYELAVKQLASEVAKIEADRQMESGRRRVAEKEYELLGEDVSAEERALMLREPQLGSLNAELEGARARLELAQLDLNRTAVRAPFNAVVMSRGVNLGTRVSPTTLATLVGSDSYWVEASIPVSQLQWISAGEPGKTTGSPVRVFDTAAWGPGKHRSGRLVGLTAMVEEKGRMATLLAEVSDPLALQPSSAGQPKLLLGSYVRMNIEGISLPHAAAIARDMIHDADQVWLMDEQGRLDIRSVEVAFRGKDYVLVTGGLTAGEQLIISNLPSPVAGMSLRLKETEAATPATVETTKP